MALLSWLAKYKIFSLLCVLASFFAGLHNYAGKKLLTFEEKKEVAKEMKKINKSLGVKCSFCHLEAEKGLKNGDYTRLTEEGEYAHDTMFPLSKKFKVNCDFCHAGKEEFTQAGQKAAKDTKWMKKYNKKAKVKVTCASCHIPGEPHFKKITSFGKKNLIR